MQPKFLSRYAARWSTRATATNRQLPIPRQKRADENRPARPKRRALPSYRPVDPGAAKASTLLTTPTTPATPPQDSPAPKATAATLAGGAIAGVAATGAGAPAPDQRFGGGASKAPPPPAKVSEANKGNTDNQSNAGNEDSAGSEDSAVETTATEPEATKPSTIAKTGAAAATVAGVGALAAANTHKTDADKLDADKPPAVARPTRTQNTPRAEVKKVMEEPTKKRRGLWWLWLPLLAGLIALAIYLAVREDEPTITEQPDTSTPVSQPVVTDPPKASTTSGQVAPTTSEPTPTTEAAPTTTNTAPTSTETPPPTTAAASTGPDLSGIVPPSVDPAAEASETVETEDESQRRGIDLDLTDADFDSATEGSDAG